MSKRNESAFRPAIVAWLSELSRGPVASYGDYFERLGRYVESSAPVCTACP